MTKLYEFHPGNIPLIISMPHNGTLIPPDIQCTMHDYAHTVPDTDWHLWHLYQFAKPLGATLLAGRYSRYVIDLNRDPSGQSLYPGCDTTELCPTTCFDHRPIYIDDNTPDPLEVSRRMDLYWTPYHTKLKSLIDHHLSQFGVCILFEAHSIRSEVPRFFPGVLADLNLGNYNDKSSDPSLMAKVFAAARQHKSHFSCVINGRFKGGFITRAYGNPGANIHTLQLELTQRCYMDEFAPFTYRQNKAKQIQVVLSDLLTHIKLWLLESGHIQ